ncbi:glycosyltransferase family 61 protein [Neobacillus vireti]|uniref:glycosyltransferase family 61 protein n=1 Tax=Neobacillus vireti TaxID=220686 RepID=UPI002FFE561B
MIDPPIGYYSRTVDFLSTYKDETTPALYKRLPIQRTVMNTKPKGVETINWHYHPRIPRQFVASIPWGRVWGSNGSVITPDNKLLWDVSFEYNLTPKTHSIFKQKELSPITYTLETLAVITFQVSFNYFHWMFDVLPRLELLRKSGIAYDRIVINRGKYYHKEYCEFQDESLKLLGISKEMIIECQPDTHILAKQLIVSSMAGYSAHVPKNVCQFLRNEFLAKVKVRNESKNKRIFISREDALHRKVLNEKEVFAVLEKYGFKMVKLSTLSFVEKIELFNQAEVIVSPHGAGLTNLIFCNPGTKVVELFTPTYLLPCFHIISNHMELDYYGLIGEVVPRDAHRSNHKDPIVIDIDKLKKTIKLAELK